MAIDRTTILLRPGLHDIGHRAGAPNPLQNLRDDVYSLHHVLPYRYPLFIGYLAETYRATCVSPALRAGWPDNASDAVGKQAAQLRTVVSRFGAVQQDMASQFAWMGPNLFQGPAGNFRIDDPGSERERIKPVSMDQALWDQLMAIGDKLDGLVSALGSGADGYQVTTHTDLTVGHLEDLLALMAPLARRGHGNALTFDATDWLCLTSREPRFRMAPGPVTATFKDQFTLHAQSNPSAITPQKPQVSGGPGDAVIWRLRKGDERVPTAAFRSPKLQP